MHKHFHTKRRENMRSNDPQQKDVTGEFAMSMRRPSSVIPY